MKSGPRGYFAVAKIERIIEKPGAPERYLALMEPGRFLPLDREVPRLIAGCPLEERLVASDNTPLKGGRVQLAVRRITGTDFARIVNFGLPENLEREGATRYDAAVANLSEVQVDFERPVVERLGSDSVRSGLALSGTLRWMFNRGLVSVADDWSILVSRNKVPRDVVNRLISPDGKVRLPHDRKNGPRPTNMAWHRENVFGQAPPDDPARWEDG